MARTPKNRHVDTPPLMKGFKPFGICARKLESIELSFEEYESIKLINYELLSQEESAKKMLVSRPTLTRIYNKALKKIAKAFVEGKAIDFEGGKFELDQDWYRCSRCFKLIQGLQTHTKCENCNYYNDNELIPLNRK